MLVVDAIYHRPYSPPFFQGTARPVPSTSAASIRSGGSAARTGPPAGQAPSKIDPMDQPPPPPSLVPHRTCSYPLPVSAEARADGGGGATGVRASVLSDKGFFKKVKRQGTPNEEALGVPDAPHKAPKVGTSLSVRCVSDSALSLPVLRDHIVRRTWSLAPHAFFGDRYWVQPGQASESVKDW